MITFNSSSPPLVRAIYICIGQLKGMPQKPMGWANSQKRDFSWHGWCQKKLDLAKSSVCSNASALWWSFISAKIGYHCMRHYRWSTAIVIVEASIAVYRGAQTAEIWRTCWQYLLSTAYRSLTYHVIFKTVIWSHLSFTTNPVPRKNKYS